MQAEDYIILIITHTWAITLIPDQKGLNPAQMVHLLIPGWLRSQQFAWHFMEEKCDRFSYIPPSVPLIDLCTFSRGRVTSATGQNWRLLIT